MRKVVQLHLTSAPEALLAGRLSRAARTERDETDSGGIAAPASSA